MKTNPARLEEVALPRRAQQRASGHPPPPAMALLGCAAGALDGLRTLLIAVIGCGSIGGRMAVLLARMGLGGLLLVDPKSYKPASLPTHEIDPEDVGKSKAQAVARRCKAVSPATRVAAFPGPVEALDLAAMADASAVVMAPDLLSVEIEAGQRSLWLGKPLIHASVHGPTLTVQVRLFGNAGGAGACPRCLYGRAELDLLARQARFSCEGGPAAAVPRLHEAPATNSLGAICSMAASLAVLQILRHLLGMGQPVADTMLEYCGFTHRTVISPLERNPECPSDHTRLGQAAVPEPLAGRSLAEAVQHATGVPAPPDAQFEIAGHDWVEFAGCGCERPAPVRRFIARGRADLGQCPRCGAMRVPLQFHTYRAVSAAILGAAIGRPLRRLGVRRAVSILLRTGDAGTLIRPQPANPSSP
ncbi:MAG: ThiF family adenylyltransferase [Verrucomicrobia bacterium]|nr:ThiF family adenylyltransferase [Verrucomicrobiota bacterium]